MSSGHLLILQVFILQAQSCSMSLFQDNFIMEEWFVFETERFINQKQFSLKILIYSMQRLAELMKHLKVKIPLFLFFD